MTDGTLREILLWAAGSPSCPNTEEHPDVDRLLYSVRKHRLGTRLLYRLKEEYVPFASPALHAELRAGHARAVVRQEQKIAALRELCHLLPRDQQPLVIKGFVTYGHSADPRHIRLSGDLDLLSPDPARLCTVLASIGYQGETFGPERHEYAHLRRGSVAIEVHWCFPVYSYPEGVREAAGKIFQNVKAPGRRDLFWQDLIVGALRGAAPGTQDLLLPDPASAAFLLCAHEFKEYLTSPFELPSPVRLAIAAEIRDLMDHPRFQPETFSGLIERFGGQDAAALTRHLLQNWFGANTGAATGGLVSTFPRPVGFRGAWVSLYPAKDSILPPNRAEVLRCLATKNTEKPCLRHYSGPSDEAVPTPTINGVDCSRDERILKLCLPSAPNRAVTWRVRADWADGETAEEPNYAPDEYRVEQVDRKVTLRTPLAPGPMLLTFQRRSISGTDFFDADYVEVRIL